MFESFLKAYRFLSPGGPVMGLIVACSVVCVALIIERYRALRRDKIAPRKLFAEIESMAREKKITELLAFCRVSDAPICRIIISGLNLHEKPKAEVMSALEMSGKREMSDLEKNLDLLGTLAAVGPLLGLLGTVTGMIQTFGVIRVAGVGDPLQLAGGIAEALLNTAGGLVVGIPALVFQRAFFRKIDRLALEMEEFTQHVFNLLKG